jgi:hypothetical protein
MKTLVNLIKLKKQELDQIKKLITTLDFEKSQINIALDNLKTDLKIQQQAVQDNADISYSYNNYALFNNQKQQQLLAEIISIEQKNQTLQQQLYELFIELKRYEIILADKEKNIILQQNQQEQNELDEMMIQRFDHN